MEAIRRLLMVCGSVLAVTACDSSASNATAPTNVAGSGGGGAPAVPSSGGTAPAPAGSVSPAPAMPDASAPDGSAPPPGDAGPTPTAGAPALDAGAIPTAGAAAADAGAQPTAGAPAMPSSGCDRTCLIGVMQGYIDALIANDHTKLKVSATLKYTENGVVSMLGETVWQTAMTLMPDLRLDFADPKEGQVASQFVFEESNGTPVIYQVRLKVVSGEITEIETMAVRQRGAANGFFNVANMKPEPVFLQPVDPATRDSREELVRITELYLDYLAGEAAARDVPFDEGCKRYENGQITASGLSSFNSQRWSFDLTRRIIIVDEEAGITWGMFPFSQSERALVVGEAFKIFGGKIMMIQAVMANQPAKVWD